MNTQALIISILGLLIGVRAEALEPREIASRALPASVSLITFDSRGKPIALGSGFFISSNRIVTNFHVIRDSVSVRAQNTVGDPVFLSKGILYQDAHRDVAVIEVNRDSKNVVTLGDSDKVMIGERIYAVGTPEGFSGTFTEGLVSSFRTIEGKKFIQISAAISHGSSGGPVLDSNGTVIAVSVSGFSVGQNLNFAIPINDIKSAIPTAGIPPKEIRTDSSKAEPAVADPKLVSLYTQKFPTLKFTKWEFRKSRSGYDFTVSAKTTKRVMIDGFDYPPGVELFFEGNTDAIQTTQGGTNIFRRVRILGAGKH